MFIVRVLVYAVVWWQSVPTTRGYMLVPGVPGLKEIIAAIEHALPDLPRETDLQDGEEFEYIVVGAGAAGSAAAARLALGGARVLLVEAGGDPGVLTAIPSAAPVLLGSDQDWHYKTLSNNMSCLSSEDQECRFNRGKCFGGSTSINYMLHVRGNRDDFELGLPGWTWNDLEPYFLRFEALQDLNKLPYASKQYHNTSGIMQVEFFDAPNNKWQSGIIKGFRSLNVPFNPDVNAHSQIGVTKVIGYVHKGERMSTARGYLLREDVKSNLRVAKNTKCSGVIIENKFAKGVKLVSKGVSKIIRAKKEVILSAGTIGTPQILMLSGVGPAEHLKTFGIPVHADLPVGEDMSEHVLPLIFIQVERTLMEQLWSTIAVPLFVTQYVTQRTGPFASNGITDITALLNTKCYDPVAKKLLNNRPECELPSLQLINAYIDRGMVGISWPIVKRSTRLSNDIITQLAFANAQYALILASPVVLRPHSRGTVRLASQDPLQDPVIFPNYLSDDRDVEEMLRSINIMEDLVETPAFKEGRASILHLNIDGCPQYSKDKRAYWRCYVRHMTLSVYHAVGTARLGARGAGVLDERLRVRGVRGLRVADLSALPLLPRGNTAAVAIALGERVADFLLQDNK